MRHFLVRRSTWVLPLALALSAACGDDGDGGGGDANLPVGATLLQEVRIEVGGGVAVDQTLVKGAEPVALSFPGDALPTKKPVTIRLASGVTKAGPPLASPSFQLIQIATPVTFNAPVKMQQPLPSPPLGKRMVIMTAGPTDDTWVVRAPARLATNAQGAQVWEADIYGQGLWAFAVAEVVPGDAGVPDAAPTTPDAGADASPVLPDGSPVPPDASPALPDASTVDALVRLDADVVPTAPQVSSLNPTMATAGQAVMLTVSGTGFVQGAAVLVDGQQVPTMVLTGNAVEATIAAARTQNPGSLAISVENVPGDARSRSGTVYLRIEPPPGAPQILDYSPDNGLPGDKVLIIAKNLAGQTLTIRDAGGNILVPGTLGSVTWPDATSSTRQSADTVEVVLPENVVTGPITVTNSFGAYRGKIFNVGRNLTRLADTALDSSSQYNTTNWSRASGADNKLETSFFTEVGDCASMMSCAKKPMFRIDFAQLQTVQRIAMRGNREYPEGYDFLKGRFQALDVAGDVLWEGVYVLPEPDRDLDIVLPEPLPGVKTVRFLAVEDVGNEPGFAELEVFGP